LTSSRVKLSATDKKVLKILLEPKGKASSHVGPLAGSNNIIATKLGIPQTVVASRRKRLEDDFLDLSYSMNLASFGFKRVDFLISTENGSINTVGNKLMKIKEVVKVGASIGEHTIDVKAELIFKGNLHLLELLDKVRSMNGVRDVVWSKVVRVIGNKGSVPPDIIDNL